MVRECGDDGEERSRTRLGFDCGYLDGRGTREESKASRKVGRVDADKE